MNRTKLSCSARAFCGLFLWTVSWSLVIGQTSEDVAARLERNVASLPSLYATDRQVLKVDPKFVPESRPGVISWGQYGAVVQFQLAYADGATYSKTSNLLGTDGIKQPILQQTMIVKGEKRYLILDNLKQGAIDRASNMHLYNPPAFLLGVQSPQGIPYATILRQSEDGKQPLRSDGSVVARYQNATYVLTPDNEHDGQIRRAVVSVSGQKTYELSVNDWKMVKGRWLPSAVEQTIFASGNAPRRTISHEVQFDEKRNVTKLFDPVWPEGGHIKDETEHKIYRVVDGKLVYDELFTKAWSSGVATSGWVFVGCVSALALAASSGVIRTIYKRRSVSQTTAN